MPANAGGEAVSKPIGYVVVWWDDEGPQGFVSATDRGDGFLMQRAEAEDVHQNAESPSHVLRRTLHSLGPATPTDAGLRAAGQALVDKLDEIRGSPEYVGVFALSQLHGGIYTGPTSHEELEVLRAALSQGGGE